MRMWVAGATGYTGRALVLQAAAAGHEVLAHVRPGSASQATAEQLFAPVGARVDTTAWVQASLRERLRALRPEAVFCLIGTTRRLGRAEGMRGAEMYEKVDYGLTAMLVSAAVASGVRPRFVYLSAMGAGPGARTPYMRARWKAETAVRNSGLPYVIARPGLLTGPDREDSRPAERFAATVSDGLLGALAVVGGGSLRDRFASMDADTLARALLSLATDPLAQHQIFEAESLRTRGTVVAR